MGAERTRKVNLRALAFTAIVLALLAPAAAQARTAYVTNFEDNTVSPIDIATNLVGPPIKVGGDPAGIAITPDGSRAYVVNGDDTVSVIDTATGLTGKPIPVGAVPRAIAITPDGARAYVVNRGGETVSVVDLSDDTVTGPEIPVGRQPQAIAITPDGSRAYVVNEEDNTLSVIDTTTDAVAGKPISVGVEPMAIAITPDGSRAYVANRGDDTVSVIDLATDTVTGLPIHVGDAPDAIAITPDGGRAFVADEEDGDVSVIDTTTDAVVGKPIPVGMFPDGIAITPDGKRAYIANEGGKSVSVIDTTTDTAVPGTIGVGNHPYAIAVVPDQPPRASLTAAASGAVATLSAAASVDPDGQIADYTWNFGDGTTASGASPTVTHTYAPGSYIATVTVTDDEGCSTTLLFTGQTAFCSGSPAAIASTRIGPLTALAAPAGSAGPGPTATPAKLRFGRLKRDKRRGTATLALTISTPGMLSLGGNGVVKRRIRCHGGTVQLPIKALGKAELTLRRTGGIELRLRIAFTPVSGPVTKLSRKVALLEVAQGGHGGRNPRRNDLP